MQYFAILAAVDTSLLGSCASSLFSRSLIFSLPSQGTVGKKGTARSLEVQQRGCGDKGRGGGGVERTHRD